MSEKRLRAVSADEKPAPPKPKNVLEAAKGGSERELLVAMRDRIAEAVSKPDCPPRDLAALSRRLHEITRDIASMDAQSTEDGKGGDVVDDSFDASAI